MYARLVGTMIAVILISSNVLSQTLEQQEQLNSKDKLSKNIDDALQLMGKITNETKLQCVKAVADEVLCKCLSENLPLNINFVNYTAIIAQTKEELGYDKLSADDKKTVDKARIVRDQCVRTRH